MIRNARLTDMPRASRERTTKTTQKTAATQSRSNRLAFPLVRRLGLWIALGLTLGFLCLAIGLT